MITLNLPKLDTIASGIVSWGSRFYPSWRLSNFGTLVILPATVTGSKHYMHKCLQDALTLTSRFHKPDIFVTMTATPKWIEIQQYLPTGSSVQS